MQSPRLSVQFFCTAAGHEPVRDFLKSLPAEERKTIGIDIKEVQLGWPLGMPLVRKMDKDLWEIRSHLPGRIVRILFTVVDHQMVLLHGFIKKSQKTPPNELKTALARKKLVKENGAL